MIIGEEEMKNERQLLTVEDGPLMQGRESVRYLILHCSYKRKCRYLFPVAGMADSGRSIAGAWGSGIYLFYGKCTVCTERSC